MLQWALYAGALRLPAAWNGKFGEVGCGGFCGAVIPAACDEMLAKGYACLATDLGHKSTGNDAKWRLAEDFSRQVMAKL